MKEIELAKRALELAMLISTETTTHAWFEYSGHVDSVTAYYAPGGWDRNDAQCNCVWFATVDDATTKVLRRIVDCFEFIYAVAERKNA